MNIDWSKAPEGATHHHVETETTSAHWRKDGFFCVVGFEAEGWKREILPYAINRYTARPIPWSGDGLPPVGSEIEAMIANMGGASFSWQRAKVVHGELPDSPGEVLVFSLETTRPAWADEFRPIRTPEQIEEEEREKVVEELRAIITSNDLKGLGITMQLRAVYDAGFRKVEVTP